MSSGVQLDMGDFDKRISLVGEIGSKAALKGLWEGAAALKKDADELVPKTPHLWGNLRGNASRGVKAKGSGNTKTEWFPKITEEAIGGGALAILVSYLAPYAARWHETDEAINWSEAGVGPKYLEAKIARSDRRDVYYGLIADRIKKELQGD